MIPLANSFKYLKKKEEKGVTQTLENISQCIYKASTTISKHDNGITRKLAANISHKYRHKNPKLIISKLNPEINKKDNAS